tara:strand:+ start:128 stop:265 length:138 start_codon:yes stop_codon:yes gene_type:complete
MQPSQKAENNGPITEQKMGWRKTQYGHLMAGSNRATQKRKRATIT